ncbi:hypothetical protein AVEN_118097-1 [Araneus ventricosus]|uniref:Uncharacterized protein n=1 Tax=Araneus ventricosus TaxID=182803 RepID=A0A4Y2J0A6_ARAVE|nr:hypothetical protein AVEN_118097-1 [Araneus ventricosus]
MAKVDEAWIYLSDTNAKFKVQYLIRDQNRKDLICLASFGMSATVASSQRHNGLDGHFRQWCYQTTVPHPKDIMVWMGISANGFTKPRFMQSGSKINSEYYIQKILKPFLMDDYCRLYRNGDAILHQDSAPSHASRVTQKFLTGQQVKFPKPQ